MDLLVRTHVMDSVRQYIQENEVNHTLQLNLYFIQNNDIQDVVFFNNYELY